MIPLLPGKVAKALGISRTSLWRWTEQGIIPDRCVVQWGKHRIRYNAEELALAGFVLPGIELPKHLLQA